MRTPAIHGGRRAGKPISSPEPPMLFLPSACHPHISTSWECDGARNFGKRLGRGIVDFGHRDRFSTREIGSVAHTAETFRHLACPNPDAGRGTMTATRAPDNHLRSCRIIVVQYPVFRERSEDAPTGGANLGRREFRNRIDGPCHELRRNRSRALRGKGRGDKTTAGVRP